MQCPRCGAVWLQDSVHCYSCGTRLTEAMPPAPSAVDGEASGLSTVQIGGRQENAPIVPPPPFTPRLGVNEAPVPGVPPPTVSGGPYLESGWTEFSGVQAPVGMPTGAGATYPPLSPPPGGSVSSSNYPPIPGSLPPSFVPPATSAPKRRGPSLAVILILSVLVLLLVFGGIFVGIRIGQSHSGAAPAQAVTTPTVSPAPDSNQLYQQVTSQNPSFVDSLQNATLSPWSVYEKPTYGCEIKSDGLHVHIKDTDHFGYCTSGRGKFNNFAFQVEMKILSGAGGGVTFRGDNLAGDLYYFHVYPDGRYLIHTEQNNKLGPNLGAGTVSSFSSGFGQNNTLTVIAQGSLIYLYVNQKFLIKIQDSTYASGYLGVAASDSTAPTEVVYTNAQIWIL